MIIAKGKKESVIERYEKPHLGLGGLRTGGTRRKKKKRILSL
jgi:hypothetical protein